MLNNYTIKQQIEVVKGFRHIASSCRTPEFNHSIRKHINVNPAALKKNLNRILYPFGLVVVWRTK